MTHTTDHQIQKLYWSIGEVATMFNESPSGIRFWLDFFGIEIHRDRKGNRKFTEGEIEKVKRIKQLVRDEGYTLKGAQRKLQAA